MAKQATRYYKVNPWKIIEEGFDKSRSMVSESIFLLQMNIWVQEETLKKDFLEIL